MATSTIGTGKDYTTLAAWESAKGGDLVTAAEGEIASCYGGVNLGACNLSGWTTDATYFATIEAASGEEHGGSYDTATGAYAEAGGFLGVIRSQDALLKMYDMQVKATSDDNNVYAVNIAAGVGAHIERCIIDAGGSGMTTYGDNNCCIYAEVDRSVVLTVVNCLLLNAAINTTNQDGEGAGIRMTNGTVNPALYVYNCTVINCDRGIWDGYGDIAAINCIVADQPGNAVNQCYSGSFDGLSDWNTSEDTTSPGGANDAVSQTVSFTAAGSGDYSLSTDISGTDLSSDTHYAFSTDILGTTRSGWSQGAFEYTAGGGGTIAPLAHHHRSRG